MMQSARIFLFFLDFLVEILVLFSNEDVVEDFFSRDYTTH